MDSKLSLTTDYFSATVNRPKEGLEKEETLELEKVELEAREDEYFHMPIEKKPEVSPKCCKAFEVTCRPLAVRFK